MTHECVAHWDDLEWQRRERGHIAGEWQSLTGERSVGVGARRVRVDPGKWSTPLHLEGSEEEIFYVLSGRGNSVQRFHGGEERAYAIGPGDCLVHRALEHAHTIRAGLEGLEAITFGERHYAANTELPRAGVSWLGTTWLKLGAEDDHPWAREAAVGPPSVEVLSDRPEFIVNVDVVPAVSRTGATVGRTIRDLGRAAGSEKTGLQHYEVEPGKLMNPPHVHSEEEEIFVVLEGAGELELWPHPRSVTEPERFAATRATVEVSAGSVIARPPGTGRAHGLRAGPGGMRLLAYGMRRQNDICFYPRSGRVSFRGVGVIGRIEQIPYWDGED